MTPDELEAIEKKTNWYLARGEINIRYGEGVLAAVRECERLTAENARLQAENEHLQAELEAIIGYWVGDNR